MQYKTTTTAKYMQTYNRRRQLLMYLLINIHVNHAKELSSMNCAIRCFNNDEQLTATNF